MMIRRFGGLRYQKTSGGAGRDGTTGSDGGLRRRGDLPPDRDPRPGRPETYERHVVPRRRPLQEILDGREDTCEDLAGRGTGRADRLLQAPLAEQDTVPLGLGDSVREQHDRLVFPELEGLPAEHRLPME